MTVKKDSVTMKGEVQVNLAPGFAALCLAIGITTMGFYAGARVIPLGGLAIAGCFYGAVQMLKSKSVYPGYVSVVVAIISMAAALALKANHLS